MRHIPQEVADAITGTYEAWQPYTAAVGIDDAAHDDDVFADALERIAALQALIEHNRANPVFSAEEA